MKHLLTSMALCVAFAAGAQSQFCGDGTYWNPISQECQDLNECANDIDNDGVIGVSDLMSLLSGFGGICEIPENQWHCGDAIDHQGYMYGTVWIGEECWFAKNLRVNSLLDGTELAYEWTSDVGSTRVYGQSDTGCLSGVCDSTLNEIVFGRHYSYATIQNSIGICPDAWHVSSTSDWEDLIDFIGENNGNAIKSKLGWYAGADFATNMSGTNSSGLNIFPGGGRGDNGDFLNANVSAYFWALDSLPRYAHVSGSGSIGLPSVPSNPSNNETLGCTIRCVKD